MPSLMRSYVQRHAIINSCKSMTRQCTSLLFIDNKELLVPKRHKKIMLTKQWYIKSVSHKSIMQCHNQGIVLSFYLLYILTSEEDFRMVFPVYQNLKGVSRNKSKEKWVTIKNL